MSMLDFIDGNPGCMAFLSELSVRPQGDVVVVIGICEAAGIKGSKAYQLWNDCCCRDISRVVDVCKKVNLGEISMDDFLSHVNRPYGIPFEEV